MNRYDTGWSLVRIWPGEPLQISGADISRICRRLSNSVKVRQWLFSRFHLFHCRSGKSLAVCRSNIPGTAGAISPCFWTITANTDSLIQFWPLLHRCPYGNTYRSSVQARKFERLLDYEDNFAAVRRRRPNKQRRISKRSG